MATTTSTTTRKRSVQDFQFGNRIGEGSYSTVYKAVDIQSKKVYAIKVLSKKHIVKEKKIKYVNIEKTTLNRLGRHPGVVTLYYTFQDDASLYFVIDMAEFGELLTIIRKLGSLSEECSKYYMIQIIDAVDFMHKKGIIHRDLKPENILVNSDMKLMITDFGAAKVLDLDDQGNIIDSNATEESFAKGSFVGTAEYVSPELLKYNKCGFECDIWAIGCILYQFLVGVPPFKGKTEYLTFEKIVNLQYQWPNFYIPSTIKDLVDSLLKTNPFDRLTIPQIQQHKWFGNFNWEDKNRIWVTNPPKLEPYQPIIQQHNENSQQLKKILNPPQPPALTSSRPRSPNSPLSRPLQQAPQPQLQRVHSPQAMPQQRIVQPKPPVPQQQQSYHQVSPIKQQIPQQSNFQQKPSAPAFVQAIKQQVPPQIKSQQPTPQLAPALVPMSSQVKPQTIVQQTQKPSRPPPQQRSTSQPSKIQPPLTTRPSPAQKSNSFSPTKPPAIRPGTNRSSPSSTSSPKSPLRSSSSNGTSGKLPLDISSKLSQCENIIKLDYINESELIYSSLYTFDPSSPLSNLKKNLGLDDVSINEIIMKNEKLLKDDSKRVVMMITDDGNLYLFKSSTLKKFEFYLKIDLTDKMFAMYDYEFSEFSESGYLILEISKIDKLIFLAPLSKEVKEDLREISNIHIGLNLSWIEALLKTKEFLKSKPSSPPVQSPASSQPMTKSSSTTSVTTAPTSSTSTVKKSQSATTASTTSSSSKVKVSNGVNSNGGSKTMNSKTKPPQAKPPKRPTSKSPTITTQQQIQQQNRKFAGGAAAAAFNAATR
ncbi:hypothetical protein WICANDRAFT_99809 [Wickerhamomyces anomalus NRRL Y-366-8]|uniref:non-specific serine/threonine protein kinase n=1 Tax=Wickerhamomyces anomalus (strain ATCC 58044 / CBS 1984 / NCYC 433 / NRRL Y-366-8) TaxID=683960 RepID=A0A1E3P7C7_WICAA|nr:uncharacterized protein WICANDRAFT_99809 [Wickerhamomyces anomalus NRRL Y-366-8]ODQ61293.1 hypothetical protein WICANDRAFT_99809 [Wickerhamomyces anomalus NRRL Y-366-8]